MPKATKNNQKYPFPSVILRCNSGDEKNPLTVDQAKELIRWAGEPSNEDWGKDFALKDLYGRKIRLLNNPSNRPLKRAIVDRYSLEFLRGVWKFNGESISIGTSGELKNGQHRFVAFVLAEQQRQIDQKTWGTKPLTMEIILVFGVPDDTETADSFDKGQNRSLDDVIYRHEKFGEDVSDKDQKKISRILSGAIRLVWLRSGGKQVSSAPHFPHSEAMKFYAEHPEICDSVETIVVLNDGAGGEKNISSLISLAYAAALHYLMTESVSIDDSDTFWKDFASGEGLSKGSPILALRSYLTNAKAGSGSDRDGIVGACIKAWLAFISDDNEQMTAKSVKLKQTKDKTTGKFKYSEFPRIGGIDSELEVSESLDSKSKLVLSCLADQTAEIGYSRVSEFTGLSKSASKGLCESLNRAKLVTVNNYEEGIVVQITSKGKSEVR